MTTIRHAMPADIEGIATVLQDALGETIDLAFGKELLAGKRHPVWVAEGSDGAIQGLTSTFMTVVQTAVRRWEIDLLAVHSSARRQGLAEKLLRATSQDSRRHRVNLSRGLVRVSNTAAQRAFRAADYYTTGLIYHLHWWPAQDMGVELPDDKTVSVIPVDTLTYRGIWLEGLDSPTIAPELQQIYLQAARTLAAREGRVMVSSLIAKALPSGVSEDHQVEGQFQWWRRP